MRLAVLSLLALPPFAPAQTPAPPTPLVRPGDAVAWVGSSSTRIGVWPKTLEFLLRTRHPELKLTFRRFSTGGGTFATGAANLDKWLADHSPTVVVFNYGGNDAAAGEKGLAAFRENIDACAAKTKGARLVFLTPQAADERRSGAEPAARRALYAKELAAYAASKGWPVLDCHAQLAELQRLGRADDESFSILKDKIHLTDAAYVAWGTFLYEKLGLPPAESSAVLTAAGEVTAATNCRVEKVAAVEGGLRFERVDAVVPFLPPVGLPPRKHVPLEATARYRLAVAGLPDGRYAVRCEGRPLGTADARQLAAGVNLNTLLLDAGHPAPWERLARRWWAGEALEEVGTTRLAFEVARE